MAAEPQRVVVIVDASKYVCAKAIKKILKEMCPQPGYELILIAILDQLSNPMGCRVWVHTNQINATTNQLNAATNTIVEKELTRKRDDYCKSKQIMKLRDYCEATKMEFHRIDVVARPFIEVASDAAKSLGATWLIVDRQVNQDKRQLHRLPCGVYRIRHDNSIMKFRDPEVTIKNPKSDTERQAMKMKTIDPDEEISPKRRRSSPSKQSTSTGISSSSMHQFMKDNKQEVQNIEQDTARLFYISGSYEASQMDTELTDPLCSVCKTKRPKVGWKKEFSYTELFKATEGFSQEKFLSENGFGSVYKAELNGIAIVVKKLKNASVQGEKEFKSEVNLLSKVRNENVVMLLGSCSEGKHRLLVYECVCNGSLDQHLSQQSKIPLSWGDRIKVATRVAKGLQYLHENNIIHGHVTSNNILITHDRQTLLGDFGFAKLEDSIQSIEIIGPAGYFAPEYAEYGIVSTEMDVYSFGVVLLELITGMRTTDKRLKGKSLVGLARPLLKDRKYHDLIDERIINSHDFHQLFWVAQIAEKCLTRDRQKRLNMIAVVHALNKIVEGNAFIIQRFHSPARSESSCSSSDSDELEGDNEEFFESEGHRSSPSEQFTSTGTSSSCNPQFIKDKQQEKAQYIEKEWIVCTSDHHEQQSGDNEASQMETKFTNPPCFVCKIKQPQVGWKRDFSYTELYNATQGFSENNFISEGGFGSFYKGEIDGMPIAVKKLKNASAQGEKEFEAEVNLLSRARHENVVMLMGSCSEGKRRLLVYEYVWNCSLYQHLSHHSQISLSWEERIEVASGTAKGLLYLHENNIIHGQVTSKNILITHDHQTLLGDFGFARIQLEDSIQLIEVIGTVGYFAPEYAEYGMVSAKMDVYCFGVVLLELITGMRTTDERLNGKCLVRWARPLLKHRKYHDLIDERIINSHDFNQQLRMVQIAEKCLIRDPHRRLNMIVVVDALNTIVEGNACITPRELSPACSESFYSSSEFDESECDDEKSFESEGDDEEYFESEGYKSSPSEQFTSTGTSSSSKHQFIKDKEQEKVQNIEKEKLIYTSDHQEWQRGDNEASQMETGFINPLCSVCKNKRPQVGWKKDFSYIELYKATQGFSQKNFISEGGFGSVYKAEFNGMAMAVKKHNNASAQGEKEFKSEVNLLSRARHENVVMLLGSCSEGKHRLLVYEYVCNGSVDQHISQHSRIPLSWEERIKVSIGVAKGLLYLHKNNIIHRDVRPNNILITHDRQALLGDFGLARNQHEDSIHSTEVIATLGYLAPEYAEYGKVSAKIDVYSFGVVLLELITGMRTTDKRLNGKSLVGWARPLLKERKYHDLIDKRIIYSHDFHQLFRMVQTAEKCLARDPQKRLNMSAVVNALSDIVEGRT